jgi:hypothetical protein
MNPAQLPGGRRDLVPQLFRSVFAGNLPFAQHVQLFPLFQSHMKAMFADALDRGANP